MTTKRLSVLKNKNRAIWVAVFWTLIILYLSLKNPSGEQRFSFANADKIVKANDATFTAQLTTQVTSVLNPTGTPTFTGVPGDIPFVVYDANDIISTADPNSTTSTIVAGDFAIICDAIILPSAVPNLATLLQGVYWQQKPMPVFLTRLGYQVGSGDATQKAQLGVLGVPYMNARSSKPPSYTSHFDQINGSAGPDLLFDISFSAVITIFPNGTYIAGDSSLKTLAFPNIFNSFSLSAKVFTSGVFFGGGGGDTAVGDSKITVDAGTSTSPLSAQMPPKIRDIISQCTAASAFGQLATDAYLQVERPTSAVLAFNVTLSNFLSTSTQTASEVQEEGTNPDQASGLTIGLAVGFSLLGVAIIAGVAICMYRNRVFQSDRTVDFVNMVNLRSGTSSS